ncbi:MAG TPA: hypothetical protein VF432_27600 [Thermoanaerobaculia bacterium]
MDTTTAIIQFIGIVLFSSAIPNDPGVHAILPRIDAAHAEHSLSYGDTKQETAVSDMGVEEHVAVLLYRGEDLLSRTGNWKTSSRPLKNKWQYVVLDGEHVQFLTNGQNAAPVVPGDLPRAIDPKSRCLLAAAKPVGFRGEFQGPAYKGAVGVVDIPFGRLSACNAKAQNQSDRVDTTLILNTEGVLVITAKKTTEPTAKTLVLDGDAVVYVANVPPHYLFTGIAQPATGDPHWEAYKTMLDTPCNDGPQGLTATQICDLSALSTAWKIAQASPPSTSLKILDSSCSNTQWP